MPRAFATATLVRQIASEFVEASDDQIAPFLRFSKNLVSIARFSDQTSDAHALATAHWMKMDPGLTKALGVPVASVGQVKSESHGPASVSYETAQADSQSDAWLSASTYGAQFKIIRDRMRGRGSAVRVGNSTPQTS